MRIDFVSDVVCPWCAIGLASLEEAIRRSGIEVEMHVQPYELNPSLGAEGANIVDYLAKKYGMSPAQIAKNQDMIRARGAEVGFAFGQRDRTFNTFNAHRLLYWAELEGKGIELERALLRAYHGDGKDVGATDTLVEAAVSVGLDAEGARAVLDSDRFTKEVRDSEEHWQKVGISGVPAIIIDNTHLISGGQPVEVFEGVLRELSGRA